MPPLDQVKDDCRYKSGVSIFVSKKAASQKKTQIETATPADGMLAAIILTETSARPPTAAG
jgi:hypothetical protein